MARPDIKDDRREQILDAFETCVARYGVEGATLGKTAEIAGLARPLIRHNVGNRDDLLAALVERFLAQSRSSTAALLDMLPAENRMEALIEILFDPRYANPQAVLVFNALSAAALEDRALGDHLQIWLGDFVDVLAREIAAAHSRADDKDVRAVAAGITGIYFNVEALHPINVPMSFSQDSKRAARLLLSTLARAT